MIYQSCPKQIMKIAPRALIFRAVTSTSLQFGYRLHARSLTTSRRCREQLVSEDYGHVDHTTVVTRQDFGEHLDAASVSRVPT